LGAATPASFGSLPNKYAELILAEAKEKHFALRDFIDAFNHRLISLFYRAWKKHHLPSQYKPGALNASEGALLSLIGCGFAAPSKRIAVDHRALIYRAGLLGRRPTPAVALESLLRSYFGTDARVRPFVPSWERLAEGDRNRLGRRGCRVGVDLFLGGRIRLLQAGFEIALGPMRWDTYRDLLPAGRGYHTLVELTRLAVGADFEFEFRLLPEPDEVPPLRLGRADARPIRLGWSTWLGLPMPDNGNL